MKFNFPLLVFATLIIAMPSCSSDDDDIINVPQAALSAMSEKYPQATSVKWEGKRNYLVADFINNSMEHEAWFDKTGQWHMTEVDILFKDLPIAVQSSFNESKYSTWRVDDVDKVERFGMEVVYVIEVEQGAREYDLYYTTDGTLVKEVPDSDNDGYLPSAELPKAIRDFISERYPNAKIYDIDFEIDGIEVDIIDITFYSRMPIGYHIHREIQFNTKNEWLFTVTEIHYDSLPENIVLAFQSSKYSAYHIDDIYYVETLGENYYLFELEDSMNIDIFVKISLEGVVSEITSPI